MEGKQPDKTEQTAPSSWFGSSRPGPNLSIFGNSGFRLRTAAPPALPPPRCGIVNAGQRSQARLFTWKIPQTTRGNVELAALAALASRAWNKFRFPARRRRLSWALFHLQINTSDSTARYQMCARSAGNTPFPLIL